MVFAASGFEHAIANMAFVPLGLLYGAEADYVLWLYQNLLIVIAGNIIGGGVAVGGAAYFLYGWTRLLDGVQRQQTELIRPRSANAAAPKHKTTPRPEETHAGATRSTEGSLQVGRLRRGARRHHVAEERAGGLETPPPDPVLVRAMFVSFDGDGDGQLDAQELSCALHALGFRYRLALLLAAARASAFAGVAARAGGGAEALFDLCAFEAAARRLYELEGLGLRECRPGSESGHGPASQLEALAIC
jgi:hypothetical protein